MSDPDEAPRWQIPVWYQRLGTSCWYLVGILIALAAFAAIVSATASLVAPVILGALLAIVFVPAVDWLEQRAVPRALAAALVLVGLVAVIVAVGWWMIVTLWGQSDEIGLLIDEAVLEMRSLVDDLDIDPELIEQVRSLVASSGPAVGGGLAALAVSVLESAVGLAAGCVLGSIVLYYLLKDGSRLGANWVAAATHDDGSRRRLAQRIVEDVRSYYRGRTLLAASNAVGIGVGTAAMGVPASGAIAVVNFFGAYVPYLGAFIGGAFAVLMTLGDGGIGPALATLALVLIINLGLENLLEPKLLGDRLKLHPLIVLLATALGGILAGILGLILAAPATAIALGVKRELDATGFFDRSRSPNGADP